MDVNTSTATAAAVQETPAAPVKQERKRDPAREKAYQQMVAYVRQKLEEYPNVRVFTDAKSRISTAVRLCPCRLDDTWTIARCNPNDVFNKAVGEYIAVKRLFGGKIPPSVQPYI